MSSFYNQDELIKLGLKSYGKNVLISRFAQFYSPEKLTIGNDVRIDDFCILSCSDECTIGNNIHIGAYSSIIGAGIVILEDFVSISGRVSIYSSSDNYAGLGLTNPMVPDCCRKVETGPVIIKKHGLVGANSVILPNTTLGEGCVIGALSLVQGNFETYCIYSGNPIVKVGVRIRSKIEKFEKSLLNQESNE